jgi:hypothetical protein
MEPDSVKLKAINDFRRGDPLRDIAARYDISEGSVSLWAKAAGLPPRRQGCRRKTRPSRIDWEIVLAVRKVRNGKPKLEEIGQRFGGMTRAGVHRIYQKWKNWDPTPPFDKGDVVRFRSSDYRVVKPGLFAGTVISLKTGKQTELEWVQKPHYAVKIRAEKSKRRRRVSP